MLVETVDWEKLEMPSMNGESLPFEGLVRAGYAGARRAAANDCACYSLVAFSRAVLGSWAFEGGKKGKQQFCRLENASAATALKRLKASSFLAFGVHPTVTCKDNLDKQASRSIDR
jgi:hypothetical protein